MWQWAIDRILEEPLLGRGFYPMKEMEPEKFNYYHTHNIILEYLLGFGLIAGSAMLLLMIGLWIRAIIGARRIGEPVAAALLMLIILLPIYAMFSATLFFPFHLMIFMASVGALIGWDIRKMQPEEPEDPPFSPEADWMFEDLDPRS